MIEQLVGFADNVVAFRCLGRVTKPDYRSVLVPAVTEALRRQRKVRLYYETGPDFSLDPGAAWEHFKVGVESTTRWEHIAVVTDVGWIKYAVQPFGFLMPGATNLSRRSIPGVEFANGYLSVSFAEDAELSMRLAETDPSRWFRVVVKRTGGVEAENPSRVGRSLPYQRPSGNARDLIRKS